MTKPKEFPKQSQAIPGQESKMHPQPEIMNANYKEVENLKAKQH